EIQVLDDSTDETRALVRRKVDSLRERGLDVAYIHRVHRAGYKAGALDHGLSSAKGELIAIFDADFLPQPEFLRAVVPHFVTDRRVGMVQARWGHLNRDQSMLTRTQALMLDGHHLVENRARAAAGWLFNFSGTGGVWRKAAIADAGGWQHDTLTEDLDLSYRAQLAGWRFVYREDVVTPAELPDEISAFRAQQFRWAKGTVQTARKLLARLMRAELSTMQRVEAFFHLTPHFAYPLMVFLSVLLLPALVMMPATDPKTMLLIDLPLVIGTSGSLAAFYSMAERAQGRAAREALKQLPALLALGAGLAPHLSKAVWEGMRSMAGEFVRTPKKGLSSGSPALDAASGSPAPTTATATTSRTRSTTWARYRAGADLPLVEMALCLVSTASTLASIRTGHWFATPFAMLFTFGYGYVAVFVTVEELARRRARHLELAREGRSGSVGAARARARAMAIAAAATSDPDGGAHAVADAVPDAAPRPLGGDLAASS
ncbi:MAG TPA: glycosyltransferase, partial [Polyangiaceae bacterium]|nr:glycosyltransferase [Polyangiaceae bacterium]